MMKLLIGTDEAGYGPNLGPLVVAATAWPINAERSTDLFDSFKTLFCRTNEAPEDRLRVGDSKEIYKSGDGLSALEKSVLPLCFSFLDDKFDRASNAFSNLLATLQDAKSDLSLPWNEGFDPNIPIDCERNEVLRQKANFESGFRKTPLNKTATFIPPKQVASVIEPNEFNAGCKRLGNKATLLSDTTLQLVRKLIFQYQESGFVDKIDTIEVICDKHGGRSHYAGILQNTFEESWIQVLDECRESSEYALKWNDWPITFQFVAKGESHLPVAYASMIAKYLREISMIAFNRYWSEQIPGIKPTAGYPVDAKRFRMEIESHILKLGLDETTWWRLK